MSADVSVIVPAYEAAQTIVRASRSVFAQARRRRRAGDLRRRRGWTTGRCCRPTCAGQALTLCRTPAPAVRPVGGAQHRHGACAAPTSSPASTRTMPTRRTGCGGCCRWWRGTGWRPGRRGRSTRATVPSAWRGRGAAAAPVPIEDICELRMPFSPVYRKALCPAGWSTIDFAEDVILNVDLYCAAGTYPFVEGRATTSTHLSDGSRTQSDPRAGAGARGLSADPRSGGQAGLAGARARPGAAGVQRGPRRGGPGAGAGPRRLHMARSRTRVTTVVGWVKRSEDPTKCPHHADCWVSADARPTAYGRDARIIRAGDSPAATSRSRW